MAFSLSTFTVVKEVCSLVSVRKYLCVLGYAVVIYGFVVRPNQTVCFAQDLPALRTKAEQGDVNAQAELGKLYSGGQGVTSNRSEALKWLRMAAEKGDAEAQFGLGSLYQIGRKEDRDYAEAAKWFRKAADQGIPGAQNDLGVLYKFGRGVKQDDAEAAGWWRKAADKDGGQDANAAFNLGLAYLRGRGVTQSYVEATFWLSIGATEEGERAVLHEAQQHLTSDEKGAVDDRVRQWMSYVRSHPRRHGNAQ
jgi:TPR repeat protein